MNPYRPLISCDLVIVLGLKNWIVSSAAIWFSLFFSGCFEILSCFTVELRDDDIWAYLSYLALKEVCRGGIGIGKG